MTTHLDHFINNKWVLGSGHPFTSHNPATRELIWQGNAASETDVSAAVTAARSALEGWSVTPLNVRINYLQRFRDILKENALHLAETISKENGKPLWESKSEVAAMISKFDFSVEAYNKRCGDLVRDLPIGKTVTRHKPHGVVAVFGPFNFPGHTPNGHIIPALLAGNTVIYKPSEFTPLVAEETIRYWEKSGLPPGVLNLVQGGRDTGRLLAGHKDIDGLFFTGSWGTGRILAEQFAKTPEKILALELGGNNPLIVFDAKDLSAAVYTIIQSAFITSGQRCSCTRRLIIPEGPLGDIFVNALVKMSQTIKVGPYTDSPEPFMGPLISEHAAQHVLAAQQTLIAKGGKPILEMRLLKVDSSLVSPGIIDMTNIHFRPDEEIFGPFLQVFRVPDFDAAIEEANNTSYGLTAGLLTTKKEYYDKFYKKIRAGVLSWNAPTTGLSGAAPFGGIKHSGNHRPSGFYAADYCSYPVATMEGAELKLPATLLPGISTNL